MKIQTIIPRLLEGKLARRASWKHLDEFLGHDEKGFYFQCGIKGKDVTVTIDFSFTPEDILAKDWKLSS